MMRIYLHAELAFLCQICSLGCFQCKYLLEHFQSTHDRTNKLQCPDCLRTFSLYGDKGYNTTVAVSFLQHLQKHENFKNKSGLHCKKCSQVH